MSVVALAGCGASRWETELRVLLPDLPLRWENAWGSAGYELIVRSALTEPETTLVPEGLGEAFIRVPKGGPVALLAYPVWPAAGPTLASGERMAPAGAVWPDGDPGSSVSLTYRHGVAASIVGRLLAQGADLRTFNTERFVHEVENRLREDPWALDTERVVAKIAARAMRASYLRPREMLDVTFDLPPGSWIPWSPFAPIVSGARLRVPYGLSRFYGRNGGRLAMEVEENGEVGLVLTE